MGRVISTTLRFIDGFTKPSKQVIDSMNEMAKNIKRNARDIQNAGKAISNVGSALTKSITIPIAGVATAAVKTAADFEQSMSQVAATMGKTKDDVKGLSELAQQMGATTAFSASEAAEGINILAMAGLNAMQIGDSLGTVLDLAAAGAMDMGSSASYIVGAVKGFGDEMKNASTYADLMAKGATLANTDVMAFGEAISFGAATAAGYSQSIDSMTLSLLRMAEQNATGQEAATSLNRAMTDLYAPAAEAKKALDSLRISAYNADGSARDFNIVVDELSGALKGMSEQQANALKSTIFTANGMKAFDKMTASTSERVKELQEGLKGAGGSAAQQARTQLDNLNGQLTLLKSAIEATAITIGNKLLPYVTKAVGWVQSAFEWTNNLNDAQVENIMKWAGIVAAVGPAILMFGKIVTMVGNVQKTFAGAIKIFTKFEGIAGLITSPAGIVIGVLAAIALAAVLIIKNWDQVKGFLQGVGNWFKNAFEKAGFSVEGFKSKFASIGNTVGSITGKVGGFFKAAAGVFKKDFAGGIKVGAAEAGSVLEALVGGTVAVFDGIVTAVDKGLQVFDALLSFFTGAFAGNWDSAAQGFRNSLKNIFPPNIAGGLTKAFDAVLPGIKAAVSGVKAMLTGLYQDAKKISGDIGTVFKGIGGVLKGIFSGDAETAIKGFRVAAGGVADTIGDIFKAFSGLGNTVKSVMARCGVDMNKFSGTVGNIKTRVGSIINGLRTIFSAASNAIGKTVKALATVIANIFGKEVSSTCSAAGAAIIALKAVAGAAFNFISGAVKKAMTIIVPAVKVAFSAAGGAVSAAANTITSVVSGVLTVFDGLITFISGVFTGNWRQAWEGVKTIFGGIFDSLVALCKAPINAVIGIINGAISGINNLGLTIPDWVPGLGGQSFSINIPTIPMLYKGTDNWKGGMAIIHDRGGEIVDLPQGSRVYPHDKSVEMARNEGRQGSRPVQITIQKLADKIEVRNDADIDRIAEALALKLKKVALNMGTA